jgi:hypothetical protein
MGEGEIIVKENSAQLNEKIVHGLLRLSKKLGWVSEMVLDRDSQEWILATVDEVSDDVAELLRYVRLSQIK